MPQAQYELLVCEICSYIVIHFLFIITKVNSFFYLPLANFNVFRNVRKLYQFEKLLFLVLTEEIENIPFSLRTEIYVSIIFLFFLNWLILYAELLIFVSFFFTEEVDVWLDYWKPDEKVYTYLTDPVNTINYIQFAY